MDQRLTNRPPIPHDERRHSLRFAVRCQCWLESDEASVFGATADVGLGGLFLRTAVPLQQGKRLEIALNLGGSGDSVVARGVVTRSVRAARGHRHGVGVAFVDILDGRAILEGFFGTPVSA